MFHTYTLHAHIAGGPRPWKGSMAYLRTVNGSCQIGSPAHACSAFLQDNACHTVPSKLPHLMPPKRRRVSAPEGLAEEVSAKEAELKRHKNAVDDACDEFLCPITLALPIDPVNAEDGHIYERSAIEDWFTRTPSVNGKVKSPATNEMIGKKLLPALRLKNMIEKMVRSGALTGEKVQAWQTKLEEQEELEKAQQLDQRKGLDGWLLESPGWKVRFMRPHMCA